MNVSFAAVIACSTSSPAGIGVLTEVICRVCLPESLSAFKCMLLSKFIGCGGESRVLDLLFIRGDIAAMHRVWTWSFLTQRVPRSLNPLLDREVLYCFFATFLTLSLFPKRTKRKSNNIMKTSAWNIISFSSLRLYSQTYFFETFGKSFGIQCQLPATSQFVEAKQQVHFAA